MAGNKEGNNKQNTSVAGHFDSHDSAMVQYCVHLPMPMQHYQGFTRSHWMLPSGDYSLRIASAATRATANKTKVKNVATLLTISMAITVRRYYTAHIA